MTALNIKCDKGRTVTFISQTQIRMLPDKIHLPRTAKKNTRGIITGRNRKLDRIQQVNPLGNSVA